MPPFYTAGGPLMTQPDQFKIECREENGERSWHVWRRENFARTKKGNYIKVQRYVSGNFPSEHEAQRWLEDNREHYTINR